MLIQLVRAQVRDGHEVRVHELASGPWRGRVQSLGVEPTSGTAGLLKMLMSFKPDVVHCHQRRCGLLSVVFFHGRRTVEHVHNIFNDQRILSFRGRAVVAVSASVHDHLLTAYPRISGKLSTIRNAVDVRDPLGEPRSAVARGVIGCGRLEVQKNPDYFLEIAHAARTMGDERPWVWVGDGSLRDEWLGKRRALGLEDVVRWIPELQYEQMVQEMERAEALVLTSRWEGLPMVALEALAGGTPVLATPMGELNALLLEAGLGEPLSTTLPSSAARRVLEACDDASLDRRAYLLDFARTHLSLEAAREQWMTVYRTVAHA